MKSSVKGNYAPPITGRGMGVGLHYLKIALRNMRRFRLQTIVCLTGLAVGMTCFSLGTLWLRFVESFEDFVPEADRICLLVNKENFLRSGANYYTNVRMGESLRGSNPGIEDCSYLMFYDNKMYPNKYTVEIDGTERGKVMAAFADTSYVRMFGIEAEEGSMDNFVDGSVALTRSTSRRLFGDGSAIGKTLTTYYSGLYTDDDKNTLTVTAIIADRPQNSQFRYDMLAWCENEVFPNGRDFDAAQQTVCSFVKVSPTFPDSLLCRPMTVEYKMIGEFQEEIEVVPIKKLRSDYPTNDVQINTQYVRWFMMLGLLVIACSLCNYVITMVSHLRRRGWEFSLRRVLGSSRVHIIYMVSTETLLMFLLATAVGFGLTLIALPYFREYSGITLPLSDVATRLLAYLALVVAFGLALSSLTALVITWRIAPQPPKGGVYNPDRNSPFRGLGGMLQMAMSLGIIFCSVVMLRQVHFLTYSGELGFRHENIGELLQPNEEVVKRVAQSPLVEEWHEKIDPIFPRNSIVTNRFSDKESERDHVDSNKDVIEAPIDSAMFRFYGLQLVAGRFLDADKYAALCHTEYSEVDYGNGLVLTIPSETRVCEVVVNEATCRLFGWTLENALGQTLWRIDTEYHIVGVIKDIYVNGPVLAPEPAVYYPIKDWNKWALVFRAKPGRLAELCDSVTHWQQQATDGMNAHEAINCEKHFGEFIASEMMLIKILFAVGLASLFVCVIGTFSLVSLSLQQRRKEIAIRKVHGARTKDILSLFLKGQVMSLLIAAIVAYPIAYVIMRHWLEGYAKQVGIDWWLIPTTFIAIAAVVLATIALKIWRAAKESTVEALK